LRSNLFRSIGSEMARPPSVTEDEVLAAARAVFLEKGVAGTTAEVAARCGVSEASVFRRFPTKRDLFVAAMVRQGVPEWVQLLAERAGRGDIRESLREAGTEIIAYYRKMLPFAAIASSNPTMIDPDVERRRRALRAAVEKALLGFFTAEMRAGRLPRRDGRAVAHVFVGAAMSFAFLSTLAKGANSVSEDVFLETLVEMVAGPGPRRKRR
jgi:AcrR family transcriptional regulator